MSDRILNHYGAMQKDSAPVQEAMALLEDFESGIKRVIAINNLTPVEIRQLETICNTGAVFAEEVLRRAIAIRQRERQNERKVLTS